MTDYILTREAMRLVDRDERGRVTKRKQFAKGDTVSSDDLPEYRVTALVEDGTLVDKAKWEKQHSGQQATADDFPSYVDKPRPDGWEDFSDQEKRDYIYGSPVEGNGPATTPNPADAPEPAGGDDSVETFTDSDDDGTGDAEDEGDTTSDYDAAVAKYSDKEAYSYADLQGLARDKVGDGSGGREDLVRRLASYEASASDES